MLGRRSVVGGSSQLFLPEQMGSGKARRSGLRDFLIHVPCSMIPELLW